MNHARSGAAAVTDKSHLAEVGESYFEHMGKAFSFSGRMIAGGVCCLIHGLFPNLFCKSASRTIGQLYEEMCVNRRKDRKRNP